MIYEFGKMGVITFLCLLSTAVEPLRAAQQADTPRLTELTLLQVEDHPWDNGDSLDVTIQFPEALYRELKSETPAGTLTLLQTEELQGSFLPIASLPPNDGSWEFNDEKLTITRKVDGLTLHHPYYYRVQWQPEEGELQVLAETVEPSQTVRQWFIGEKSRLAAVGIIICGSVIIFIGLAKRGMSLKVRKIAGLEAVDEAVGRATEMGRSVLFVPGIQDMNEIQTIAGLNILSHVAQTAAEFDAKVEVPTSKALVMTAARETLQGAFLSAGRPDAYNPDLAYYVTDEQFGYVAYVSGTMVREKPAACFYLGSFFAESLILAETGNSIGAIQVAGTAQPSQLPFFVAACDYTLIGEELFAASAYLSGSPEELGSLKGQDMGKILVAVSMILGCLWATSQVWNV